MSVEHWDALCEGGYRFVYDDALFPPGTDTFLLSSLPKLRPGLRVCDLGSGTGLLGLLLLQRQPELQVTGVEVQEAPLLLARRTAGTNGLDDRLTFIHGDLRQTDRLLPAGRWDLVVCNPPYYPQGSGRQCSDPALRTARSECSCTLTDVCSAARRLLRWGGSFCLVHKPERLTDLLCAMREAGVEPKRLRPVCASAGHAPSLLLIEGRRGGRPGLTWEAPLFMQDGQGRPSAELDTIYFRKQEDTP